MKRIIQTYVAAFVLSAALIGCRSQKKAESEYVADSKTVVVETDSITAKSTSESETQSDIAAIEVVFTPPDTSGKVYVSRIKKTEISSGNRSASKAEFTEIKRESSDNTGRYRNSHKEHSQREPLQKPMIWLTAAFAISLTIILILNKRS